MCECTHVALTSFGSRETWAALAYPFFLPDTTHPINMVYTAVQMGVISGLLIVGEILRVLNLCAGVAVCARSALLCCV